MAPSITEAVSQTTEHIQEKLAAINVKDVQNGHTKNEEEPAPAVQEPEVQKKEDLEVKPIEQLEVKPVEESTVKPTEQVEVKQPLGAPHLETQHKEPLVLSGVLDAFKSFDVTPVIGREFVGVDLAAWLKAPNSDALIRDLAITSKFPPKPHLSSSFHKETYTNLPTSLAARCSFLPCPRQHHQ